MWLEGPEGSITTVDTNPEPQGGGVRGDMVMVEALGGYLKARLELHPQKDWEEGDGKEVMAGAKMGEAISIRLQAPVEKAFSYSAEHTCRHWQKYKCVNTEDAYRQTQTGRSSSANPPICSRRYLWQDVLNHVSIWISHAEPWRSS